MKNARSASLAVELRKLRWRCRRGMRELDAVLQRFLEAEGAMLDAQDIERFARVLELPDPTLYAYIVGRRAPADFAIADLIARIRRSHRPQM